MKITDECFNKVKQECFKFIKSQETSTEKFKGKEKMLKSFLIPLCTWISKKADKQNPYFVGLAGGQGTGKTTISSLISIILKKYFKKKVFRVSIDDFYKTRRDRTKLSKSIHPMLMTRGVPGTHDLKLMKNFFKGAKQKKFKSIKVPKFDKSIDDRSPKKNWYNINKKPDIIIFEGWCVGAKAEENRSLKNSINMMERNRDKKLIWRKFVNQQLNTNYKKLYAQLNSLIYLKAKDFSLLQKWRMKQEKKLKLKNKKKSKNKIMNKNEVLEFMQTYQRVTENMFKKTPKYASVIMNLNSNHIIKSAVYRGK